MRQKRRLGNVKRQRGAAAIEAAIIIPFILLPILACMLFLSRFIWYYSVAQKAVHDSALYMAGAPPAELKGTEASTLALSIIAQETADLDSTTETYPAINCGYKLSPNSTTIIFTTCNPTKVPVAVQSTMAMTVSDPIFSTITAPILGGDGLTIFVYSMMNYAGR
jgi:Flp pilus assembly protein TadG